MDDGWDDGREEGRKGGMKEWMEGREEGRKEGGKEGEDVKVERGGRDRMGEGDLNLGKFQRIMG
jgi:hypothetical protein